MVVKELSLVKPYKHFKIKLANVRQKIPTLFKARAAKLNAEVALIPNYNRVQQNQVQPLTILNTVKLYKPCFYNG